MLKEECKEYMNSSLIVLKEKEVIKVAIDQCQLKDEKGKKCDFVTEK